MPNLDLTREQLAAPTRLECAYIEGLMLWPDDASKRAAQLATSEREFAREIAQRLDDDQPALTLPDLARFLGRIGEALPLQTLKDQAKPRYLHGFICGYAIFEIVARKHMGVEATSRLDALKQTVKNLSDVGLIMGERISADYLHRNRWDTLKPVLHLWAAYVGYLSRTKDGVFPCRANRMPNLLAESEWWLDAAAEMRPPHASTNLLEPADAWRPLPAVAACLPRMELKFVT
jgi:hypothetical protein